MISLECITDTNLISARSYGIEIEIESLCNGLEEMERHEGAPMSSAAVESMLREYEATLRDVVVHAWPLPSDPVVVALRERAKAGLACLHRVTRRARDSAPDWQKRENDFGQVKDQQ